MASVNILDWRGEVAKYAKGVDNASYTTLLDDEIKEVLRDFCERTHLWTQTLSPFVDVVANTSAYDIYSLIDDSDGDADIEIVESVQYKEDGDDNDQLRALWPMTDWINDDAEPTAGRVYGNTGSWRYVTAPQPTHFYIDTDKTLNLYPIPTVKSDEGLRVALVLKPRDDATEVPEFIYKDWKKAIAWGAAGRLLGMTTQKWFNRDLGDYYWDKYKQRRTAALLKKQTGFTRRDLKVQFPNYGGSRSRSWVF